MKKIVLAVLLIAAIALPLAAQNGSGPKGNGPQSVDCPKTPVSLSSQPLTAQEISWILFMREEEKLALEVYQSLFQKWNLRIFSNIATSEQRHFDAIGALIKRYNLTDPAQGVGVYTNSELQDLYDELIVRGGLSAIDGLQVGVLIEKADIADLEAALLETKRTDIKKVFTNLLSGSLNHLDAFESNLEVLGVQ